MQATEAGAERVVKSIGYSVKSAKWAIQQRATRAKRVGSLVTAMKARGLTVEQIVAELTH